MHTFFVFSPLDKHVASNSDTSSTVVAPEAATVEVHPLHCVALHQIHLLLAEEAQVGGLRLALDQGLGVLGQSVHGLISLINTSTALVILS